MTSLIQQIAAEVAGEFGSTAPAILAPTRGRPEDARARAIAMFIYARAESGGGCEEPCMSEVGRAFNRDRTTVRHAYARVYSWMGNASFARQLSNVEQRVAAKGYPGGVL